MSLREPISCVVDLATGVMQGAAGAYEKRLADLEGLYADAAAFTALKAAIGNPVVYAVTDQKPEPKTQDLIFGVTRMMPGKVGDEYFLTRGHIHARADRPEIYYGQAGSGVMLLEAPDGDTRAVEIGPHTVCYVPPYWIHRSVNVGDSDLVMLFAYPADAGQDYGIIERSGGMRARVVTDGLGGWRLVDNPAYRPRDAATVAALLAG